MSDLLSDISFILPGHGPKNVFPTQPDLQLMEWTPPPETASMCQSGSVKATT
jgi:hypothetical protein